MGFFDDVFSFEKFNAGQWGKQLGQNPARLLYGSADPFSTRMWNSALGTNDKPMVDQWGGAPKQRYEEAQKQGINTGPGGTMHGVARSIASIYAGGAANSALSGAGGAGAGAGVGAAEGGAGTMGAVNAFDSGAMAGALGQGSTGAASAATANGLYRAGERAGYDGSQAIGANYSPNPGASPDWMRVAQNMPTGQQQEQRQQMAPAPRMGTVGGGLFTDYAMQPVDLRRKKRTI